MSELNNIFRPTDEGKPWEPHEFPCDSKFIHTFPEKNTITFVVQEGPIKDNGINGCQVDDMIWATATIIRDFNRRFPCRENSLAITKLEEAMHWLKERKKDRENRGVEGLNKE